MKVLCLFMQCNWIYLFSTLTPDRGDIGVYQCSRCKEVSVGHPFGPHNEDIKNDEDRIMEKKYVVYPGYLVSKQDGQEHYINASQLIRLYNVNPKECIIIDYKVGIINYDRPDRYKSVDIGKLIALRPRWDGDYKL